MQFQSKLRGKKRISEVNCVNQINSKMFYFIKVYSVIPFTESIVGA